MPAGEAAAIKLGTNPGYVLRFFLETEEVLAKEPPFLEITGDDYAVEIDATLPEGLNGGRYEFVVEGMTDAHHKQLAAAEGGTLVVAHLHLYWRDGTWSGWAASYFGGILGIGQWVGGLDKGELQQTFVTDLAVTHVTRRLGARRYETVIRARERAWNHLVRATVPQSDAVNAPPQDYEQAVHRLCALARLDPPIIHAFKGGKPEGVTKEIDVPWTVGERGSEMMKRLGEGVESATGKYGRGIVLFRDGKVNFGVREISTVNPLPKPLTLGTGLLQSEALTPIPPDNFHSMRHPDVDPSTSSRPEYRLTLRGRADIKPGDVVQFERPPETDVTTPTIGAAFLGPFAGGLLPPMGDEIDPAKAINLYVSSVRHQLGRSAPFMTTLTGIVLMEGGDAWDPMPAGRLPTVADPALNAARAIQDGNSRRGPPGGATEIAEVKGATVKSQPSPPVPAQTLTAIRGLVDAKGTGLVNAARALEVDRKNGTELRAVTYATPFAFGACGLVLPQYPGTRLVLSHRAENPADPVAIGSTWGPSARPEKAEAGDWWLSLPSEVPPTERASLPAGKTPTPYKGKASHDLIDADGARVIQVGSLTVRVGAGALEDTSKRPEKAGASTSVLIEHKDKKARIEIAQDGSITIETPENLTLKATKTINLEAMDVKVKVQNKMDVS